VCADREQGGLSACVHAGFVRACSRGDCVRAAPIALPPTVSRMAAPDLRRYPRPNERGLGPATSRQLWRLNQEGLLAIRKAPGRPLVNREVAHLIAALVDREQRARFEREREGASS
jgi:hypothetical protein